MGKLHLPSSRLAPPSRKVGFGADLPPRAAPRAIGTPWKAWYKTKRWRDLKALVHLRDAYTCQRSGVICGGAYPADDSPVANHKRPHRGDPVLFWDPDNVETVSKATHDSLIQAEEQASRHTIGVWD